MVTVTYSPAYTVVPTYSCYNRCSYCNFRVDADRSPLLTLDAVRQQLVSLPTQDVIEILILSGEVHPHSSQRSHWFQRIFQICELALDLGFLPHTNVGPLAYHEMRQLRLVNVSMGLMLEQVTPKLLQSVHRHSPSKRPEVRLRQLEWAGELQIPFTTGLLLGLGESEQDRLDTLEAIAQSHNRWGHIQEVILQPHSPGSRQRWQGEGFRMQQLPEVVAIARHHLPDEITIQIPPNLVHHPSILLDCLDAGARDLGGIGPKDEVNPDYPHPTADHIRAIIEPLGWTLHPRLPIYPPYYSWLSSTLKTAVEQAVSWIDGIEPVPHIDPTRPTLGLGREMSFQMGRK
ncbi:MAG: 7,8-didemethyl-8-hydroxy-5-deazariboflavin synthase subunit CofG [Leptolyngbyaceae bacterium]|nr:7,8-didemethyl-8-hydroxy-5-deazariboflavin synthase subunit CofG [Leptolyngbyaceae bacterium]